MKNKFTLNNESYHICAGSCRRNSLLKLPVTDWLSDLPENTLLTDLVEVQFKNTRKGYFRNSNHLPIEKGTTVIVSASHGYDLGEVTLVGALVVKQMKKYQINLERYTIGTIYRIATDIDKQKSAQAKAKEQQTMIDARRIARDMHLDMKIGDVEYQGDGTKAIFYYIADGRVNFRELIKVYAETFRVRIEMKQIGVRQEAGRIGGTGDCGRELCCSTWMTDFTSVVIDAVKLQNLSLNTQKMTGQCAKLKCCYNYEVAIYEDAMKELPSKDVVLQTQNGDFYLIACNPLKKELTYSMSPNSYQNLQIITAERAKHIIEENKQGRKPVSLGGKETNTEEIGFGLLNEQDNINRFDKKRKNNNFKGKRNNERRGNERKNR